MEQEVRLKTKKNNTDNIILGKDCIVSSDTEETGLNNNIIICGSSGCGKTMSVAEPRMLNTYNSSLCITLTKRRLVNKYKRVFAERGYRVWDLDMVHFENSNVGFDPLAYVRDDKDITFLADSIVKLNPEGKVENNKDPYWENAASSLLAAEIAIVRYMNPKATMTDVLKFHDEMKIAESDGAGNKMDINHNVKFKMLEEIEPDHFAVSCWKSFCILPSKTCRCVFGSLNVALDTIFSPDLRKMMAAKRKVDFEQMSTEKTVLFVTTSPVNPSMQRFINIFYGDIFKQLFEFAEKQPEGVLPVPVHVLCDDFATGGKVMNFADYISVFREKGISVSLLIQSETQLASMYGEYNAITIINNCDTYVYMGGMDIRTVRDVSERLDVPLSEVLKMPVGKECIFRRGLDPVMTERYNIREDPEYKRITSLYEDDRSVKYR